MNSPIPRKHGVVIIADDLTGACDAAVHFAAAGLATYIGLHYDDQPPPDWEAWAINTDTRCSGSNEAAARVSFACESARRLGAAVIVKKIDSTMRGNVAAEIEAARAVFQPRITLLAPAFPALGRIVRSGSIFIEGGGAPIAIGERLPGLRYAILPAPREQDVRLRWRDAIARAAEERLDILIPDTESERDLRLVAEAAAEIDGILLAGSGGLTKAIASTLGSAGRTAAPLAGVRRPVLICAGSDHGATLRQLKHVETQEHALFTKAGPEGYRHANAALAQGRNVVLLLERSHLDAAVLREFAETLRIDLCGALLLTGGDTAMHVLDALGAKTICCRSEILPGLPEGEILGGAADGLLLVTKSGAFGAPDALSRCIEILRTPAAK